MTKKYKLTKENFDKVGRGAAIAILGSGITVVSEALLKFDYGEWTPAVVALVSVLVNLARKWLSDE